MSREAMEEVDLELGSLTEVHTGSRTAFFYCTEWSGNIKLSHEHQDYKWISPKISETTTLGEITGKQ